MTHNFDVFLSHNWGKDEEGRDNHHRVSLINMELKKNGYRTWFDNDQMHGEIVNCMADGIEGSNGVIAFITKKYHDKVNGENFHDNSKLEFSYAVKTKTSSKIVAVVMEQGMCDTINWKRSIGMHLSGKLYINMSGELTNEQYLIQQMDLLLNELKFMGIEPSNTIDRSNGKGQLPSGISFFILLFLILVQLTSTF